MIYSKHGLNEVNDVRSTEVKEISRPHGAKSFCKLAGY